MENNAYRTPDSNLSGRANANPYQLAHPGKRFQAQFIDGLISVIFFALGVYVNRLLDLNGTYANLAVFALPVFYYLFSDALPRGQSIGKRLLKMSVVHQKSGRHCNLLQSFLRNSLTPVLGWLDSLLIFGKEHKRVGDYLAGTIVVKVKSQPSQNAK